MKEWFVLYVNARAEKKVASLLQKSGREVFCPLKSEYRQWSDRVKKVEVPYFRSYVFVKFEEKEASQVLATPGVVRRLFWLGQPAVIREEEMQSVREFFEEYKEEEIIPGDFETGEEVEILKGDLRKKTGVILRQSPTTVVLRLPALNSNFKVVLSKGNIGKIK